LGSVLAKIKPWKGTAVDRRRARTRAWHGARPISRGRGSWATASPDWKRPSKNAVHDASESPGVAVTFGSERVAVCFEMAIALDSDGGPVMESKIEGLRASSRHDDLAPVAA